MTTKQAHAHLDVDFHEEDTDHSVDEKAEVEALRHGDNDTESVSSFGHSHPQAGPSGSVSTPKAADLDPSAFPADFDWKTREQLHRLMDENGTLKQKLSESVSDVERLQDALVTLQEELAVHESHDTPQTVAKELARKNRGLSVQLERQKAKAVSLQATIEKLTGELEAYKEEAGQSAATPARRGSDANTANAPVAAEDEVKVWKEKYQRSHAKLAETKSQLTTAKAECEKAQRLLRREIGEDVSFESVWNETGKWRGRAQEISLLKDKIRELRKSIEAASPSAAATGPAPASPDAQDRHELALQKMKQDKLMETAALAAQAESAKADADTQRKKVSTLSARNKVLENTSKDLRDKIQVLLSKSDTDDRLIEELKQQLEQARKAYAVLRQQQSEAASSEQARALDKRSKSPKKDTVMEQQVQLLQEENKRLKSSVFQQLRSQINEWDRQEKDAKITLLHTENEQRKELVAVYSAKLEQAQQRILELTGATPNSADQKDGTAGTSDAPKKVGGVAKVPAKRGSVGPTSQKESQEIESLKRQLEALTKEHKAVMEQVAQTTKQKQEEVTILNNIVAQTRAVHQRTVNALRQQMLQFQNQFSDDPKANTRELIENGHSSESIPSSANSAVTPLIDKIAANVGFLPPLTDQKAGAGGGASPPVPESLPRKGSASGPSGALQQQTDSPKVAQSRSSSNMTSHAHEPSPPAGHSAKTVSGRAAPSKGHSKPGSSSKPSADLPQAPSSAVTKPTRSFSRNALAS